MKTSSLLSLLLAATMAVSCQHNKVRKTVFIVMDGVTVDNIERIHPPVTFDIASRGAYSRGYCGGQVATYSETPTISAVGYNNILTGTWVNKHNVSDNSNQKPNYNYWSIFRIAKAQSHEVKTGLYSSWTDNRTMLLGAGKPETDNLKIDYVCDGYDRDTQHHPRQPLDRHIFDIDSIVCERAAEGILNDAPDLSWVYLWYTDDAYHLFGDGTYSDDYVLRTDAMIGRVWEAVKQREAEHNEEWLVIVLTDHGRDELGYDHGTQSPRARHIWMSTNLKEVNGQFAEPHLSHADVNPTICRWMGWTVPRDVAFEQDGTSFYGPRDIYALESHNYDDKVMLRWQVDEGKQATAQIYMATTNHWANGQPDEWQLVATVPATEGGCTVNLGPTPSDFYKFAVQTEHTTLTLWHPRNPARRWRPE